jgi:hypothetical protein
LLSIFFSLFKAISIVHPLNRYRRPSKNYIFFDIKLQGTMPMSALEDIARERGEIFYSGRRYFFKTTIQNHTNVWCEIFQYL